MFNRALNSLDLCNNNLGEASETIAQAVLQHPTMEVFCNIPMKKMREDSLTELDLSRKGIGAHGAMVIAPLLEFSRSLNSINLLHNDLGDGAAAVVAAAKQNGNIKTLCGIEEGKSEADFQLSLIHI